MDVITQVLMVPHYQRASYTLSVALALREQILEARKVPTSLYDWPMDVIVGPDEIVLVEGGTEDKFRSW